MENLGDLSKGGARRNINEAGLNWPTHWLIQPQKTPHGYYSYQRTRQQAYHYPAKTDHVTMLPFLMTACPFLRETISTERDVKEPFPYELSCAVT